MQGDAGPFGQHLHGLAEFDALDLHHEAEDIAPDVADPALERLPLGIDLHAGPRVVMPGAQAHVVAALSAQGDMTSDEVDDVDRLPNLFFSIQRR